MKVTSWSFVTCILGICVSALSIVAAEPQPIVSYPAIRELPQRASRPLEKGPTRFVDAARGNDNDDGSEKSPWQTIAHALKQLSPGDTLCLRDGVYHENVYCAVTGRPDAPITIRSYPGEQAIIDGGLAEFYDSPATAWEPFPAGGEGEYRSTKAYKNIRDVVGLFGDSHIGLQTYWHAKDLRAKNELVAYNPEKTLPFRGKPTAYELEPMYCGPGIWYEQETGYIHVRLAHTNLKHPLAGNYRGETDPRKVPLIIAPFQSTPLFVDMARHVRFQDLVIRGGGYKTVNLLFGVNLEFDNCTIYAGTYGVWAKNTGPLKMTHCGVYGMCAPWCTATENGLQTFSPRYQDPFLADAMHLYLPTPLPQPKDDKFDLYSDPPHPLEVARRNIARLPTHAVLVTEGGYEFETFFYPFNHDWEISYCEFTDSHDGVYPSGHHIKFHHNWIDRMNDDGIYLSSPSPYTSNKVHVYQNLITRTLSAFGLHGRGGPRGDIYVYRNIVDARQGILRLRPTMDKPEGDVSNCQVFLMHGGDGQLGVESLYWYQNTFLAPPNSYGYLHSTWMNTNETTRRRSFNNIHVYLNNWFNPRAVVNVAKGKIVAHDIVADGNLHWCTNLTATDPGNFLQETAKLEISESNKKNYALGWDANSLKADPLFIKSDAAPATMNDYGLQSGSPAIGAGIVLPPELDDPLRPQDGARPDIGAVPAGQKAAGVGRYGRVVPGSAIGIGENFAP